MSKVEEMRNRLFYKTFDFVKRKSPFYRELYRHIELDKSGYMNDLLKLPILDEDKVIKNQSKIIVASTDLFTHHRTGGTTGHVPMLMHRSRAEERFRDSVAETIPPGTKKKRVILLLTLFHGYPWVPFSRNIYITCFTPFNFDALVHFLTDRPRIPGVEDDIDSIHGNLSYLKRLTWYLLSKNIDPSSFGVRYLESGGYYVSKKWRAFFEKTWKARFKDGYSVSEILGDISQCEKCGFYHPGISLIPEVVSIEERQRIVEGVGFLLLTGLYPLQQTFPMLRYNTGDLFEIRREKCVDVPLVPRGRFSRSIYLKTGNPSQTVLITAGDVIDVMEEIPDVRRSMEFEGAHKGIWTDDTSWEAQLYSMSTTSSFPESTSKKAMVRLNLELNYDPRLYPSRTEEIRGFIFKGFSKASPTFAKAVSNGSVLLKVDFHPPGSLTWDEIFER